MKQKILDALKTRYEGVSDTILDRVADKLAKTVTDDDAIATAVDGAFNDILEAYGDRRATDASKTAVANYERKHGLKDGQKVSGGEPAPIEPNQPKQDDMPAWAQALVDSNKKLAERLAAIDGERTATTRRGKLDELLKDLPEQLRKPYQRIDLTSMTDEAFDNLMGELPNEIGELQKTAAGNQAVFGRPRNASQTSTPKNTNEASAAEVDAVVKNLHV